MPAGAGGGGGKGTGEHANAGDAIANAAAATTANLPNLIITFPLPDLSIRELSLVTDRPKRK